MSWTRRDIDAVDAAGAGIAGPGHIEGGAGVRPLRLHAHEQHQETGNSTEKKRLYLALCRAIATRLDYCHEIATHRN